MTLSADNMYSIGYGLEIDGNQYLTREKLYVNPKIGDKWHIVTEGDRLDLLAWRYYKSHVSEAQNYWWLLADANNISNPFSLSDFVGRYFLIPEFFRTQKLISDTKLSIRRANRLGDVIPSLEIQESYSINEIYPLTLASSGATILPNYGTPIDPIDPIIVDPKRVHLFFEKQNNGGFMLAYLDENGTICYDDADPNDYNNSLIAEIK